MKKSSAFNRYELFVIAVMAFLQFTVILDFTILSPLGAILLEQLNISPKQFGLVVSAYAFSAGASGLIAAGFADRFDRKRLLLFFYGGFILGTLLCGVATSFAFLLFARVVTGLFGGVIGSICFAIIADLFPFEARGRVMGSVQTAFAASQVLGLPMGLYLSNHFGWHAPFFMIVGVSVAVGVLIVTRLKPINAHLSMERPADPFAHLRKTVVQPRYLWGFGSTMLLATGGFMLMPFGSAFSVHNLGIPLEQLPTVYMATGIASIIGGPIIGRFSDTVGKFALFAVATIIAMGVIVYYTRLGVTPLWGVIGINIVLFLAITGRGISAQALATAIPDPPDRGAYMAVTASLQQLSGGVASFLAGLIVIQTSSGFLERYEELGYVVAAAMLVSVLLMYKVNELVKQKRAVVPVAPAAAA